MTGAAYAGPSPAFASHWDGLRWSDHRPFGDRDGYHLADVTATGGKAWFAGSGRDGGVVAEWDGQAFRHVRTGIGGGLGQLNAVSVKDGQLWAVGSAGDENAPQGPLVYHEALDGKGPVRQQVLGVPQGELTGIWQVSPSDVWAVGFLHCYGDDCERPLAMHWDGSAWSRVQVPLRIGELRGVAAIGKDRNDVWLSGVDLDHRNQMLFLHYDGKAWTREYGPQLMTGASAEDDLNRVNRSDLAPVPGTSTLWAVGSVGAGTDDGDPEEYFVLRREGP
ncbi:hypothetical protein AB0C21_17575 [Spirillospora sp. NPDC049024]